MNGSPQRIIISLPDGFKLVAEQNIDPNYDNEIYVGLMNQDGVWYQDLAIVRPASYHHNKNETHDSLESVEVLVYADKDNEDYTNAFTIGLSNGAL